jgi:phosphatidate cytidylyltransferase
MPTPTENADLAPAKTDRQNVAKGLVPRQLLLRIASALIMAPIAVAAVYGGDFWLAALACVVGTVGMYEWNNMAGVRTRTLTAANVLIFLVSLTAYQLQEGAISLVIIVAGAVLCGLISLAQHGRFIWAVWGQLYIGLAILSIVWMQDIYGWEAVIWLLFIIWAMDIGAYFAGSLIGGPKLAPRASPNKTWAGLIGGATTACLVSWLAGGYLDVAGEQVLIVAGIGLALWSQLGDIIESLVKRHFGVKDSGAIIPGHGGVLDRIDSLLFTLPVLVGVLWLWPNFLALNS